MRTSGTRAGIWTRVLTGAGIAAVVGGFAMTPAQAATVAVSAVDNAFEPRPITVAAGDTLVWTNNGQRPHNITLDNGSATSGTLNNGQSFSRAFTAPGTFAYYCSFHGGPGGEGMSGTITVAAAQATTTTLAPAPTTTAAPAATPTTVAPTASAGAGATTTTTRVATTATTRATAPTTVATAPTTVATAPGAVTPATTAVPLARTGTSSMALVFIGTGILLIGVAFVMSTRDPAR